LISISFKSRLLSVCLRSAQRDADDCRSCLECSRDNGCVRCPERLFLFLQRDGMSHHGTCLLTCPPGHYEQKGKDMNRCMKCRSLDCEHCFSRDFCTKCKAGFQLYKGKCLSRCPQGTFPHHTDCLGECIWSEWGVCQRDGATCGYRWGKQTRTRGTSDNQTTTYCPLQAEMQRCRMKKRCTYRAGISKQYLYSPLLVVRQRISTRTVSSHFLVCF
uniref:R-spondin 4 n=1 Tax=Neogobius melanostomus TaxID=47308 RepID=A0A8C6UHM3_9GOBI